MKTGSRNQGQGRRTAFQFLRRTLAASLLAVTAPAFAADDKAGLTPEQMFEGGTNTYNNWVEVSAGGMFIQGSKAQAEYREQHNRGLFGGIEDLHYQQDIDKKTQFTLDGRSIFGENDYQLTLGVKREDTGYLRLNFENFRTWYNTAGGFFPPDLLQFGLGDATLDRGEVSLEAGYTPKTGPRATFKYTHRYRDGDKNSTIWGPVETSFGTRAIFPSLYHLDETADIFQLDLAHRIKATDLGLGLRYEIGDLEDTRKMVTDATSAEFNRKITNREGTSYDMLSVHAFSETWLKKNMLFSAGFLFANLDNSFSGSRISGEDFNVIYTPNPLNDFGYLGLNGGSHRQEYTFNLNLMTTPANFLTVTPSIRAQYENWDADSSGIGTLADFPAEPFLSTSTRDLIEVRERVDVRYTGVTNWVFYAGPEFTEGQGNWKEFGGLTQIAGVGVPPVFHDTDDSHFYQKYFGGARWYPLSWLNLDGGAYYKNNNYDYNHDRLSDSTPNFATSPNRYPAYLVMQGLDTYDGNLRLTLRPRRNVTLVSRYEYQNSTIHTSPDPASGLSGVDTSEMNSHLIGQNAGWTPFSRLNLQVGFNYVLSETKTPTSEFTRAVLNAQNNYWTLNFNSGIVLDDQTDLNLGYFYYRADDFEDNSTVGLPLGAAAEEHAVTAAVSRRLTQNLRLNLKYGYAHYADLAGFNSYQAHLVYSSLQYRF